MSLGIPFSDDSAAIARVRAARLFEPDDYCRRLTKRDLFPDGGERPLEVDLGCGDGGFLIDLAAARPDRRFLGIERLLGRARKVARRAARRGLTNVKAWRVEVGYAVGYLLPEGGVSRVHLLFPDPWPKKRHLKNRLVKPEFCLQLHRALEPGGEWLFKTDDPDLFDDVVGVVGRSGLFERTDWSDEAFGYPSTDFERQWIGEGRRIHRARFLRREGPPAGEGCSDFPGRGEGAAPG